MRRALRRLDDFWEDTASAWLIGILIAVFLLVAAYQYLFDGRCDSAEECAAYREYQQDTAPGSYR